MNYMTDVLISGLGAKPVHDSPQDDDLIIRQSTIGSMELCPARVGYSLHPDFDSTPSEAMVFGTVVHDLIAQFLQSGDQEGAWPLRLATDGVIHGTLQHTAERDDFVVAEVAEDIIIERFIAEVREAVLAWYSDVWAPHLHQISPSGVEQTMVVPLGILPTGRSVWLQGTPDLFTEGTAYDWKTTKWAWKENKHGYTKGSFSVQAPLYLALIERSTGLAPRRFVFVVYDRKARQWTEHETDWTAENIQAAWLDAWEWAKQIDAQAFPFTPSSDNFGKYERGWHCSPTYCGAWNVCEGKGLIADGYDLTITRDRRWT